MEPRQIPFSPPDISEEEIEEVADTLRSGWITTGPKTKKFEKEIADFCHTKKAVCLNSSTAAMEMTLRLFGIGPWGMRLLHLHILIQPQPVLSYIQELSRC